MSTLAASVQQCLQQHHLPIAVIAGLATLTSKANEPALLALSQAYGWPLLSFTAAELREIATPNPSVTVAGYTGTPSVAEAAALRAARRADPSSQLLIPKQIYRQPRSPYAVTLAIASTQRHAAGAEPSQA
ncbi:MAG: cobalamin biosynthesis protein [Spirulinaceae cyanobacterium SM2_1_0]|nr:cobalamin biosynthesis protein [Spirulinaceae cyanobacterium SM2_1_0]